jgi:hypothetical protein
MRARSFVFALVYGTATAALAQNAGYVRFASATAEACAAACSGDQMCASWSFSTDARSFGHNPVRAQGGGMCSFLSSSVTHTGPGIASGLPRRDSNFVASAPSTMAPRTVSSNGQNTLAAQQSSQSQNGRTGWEVQPAPWLTQSTPAYAAQPQAVREPVRRAAEQPAPQQSARISSPQIEYDPQPSASVAANVPASRHIVQSRPVVLTPPTTLVQQTAPRPTQQIAQPQAMQPSQTVAPRVRPSYSGATVAASSIVASIPSDAAAPAQIIQPARQPVSAQPIVRRPDLSVMPAPPRAAPRPVAPTTPVVMANAPSSPSQLPPPRLQNPLAVPAPPPGTQEILLPRRAPPARLTSVTPTLPSPSQVSPSQTVRAAALPASARVLVPQAQSNAQTSLPTRPATRTSPSSRPAPPARTPAPATSVATAVASVTASQGAPPRQEVAVIPVAARASARGPVRDPNNPESFRGADGMIDAAEMRRAQLNFAREQGTPAYSVQREWEAVAAEQQRAEAAGEVKVDPLLGTAPVPPPPETRSERRAREAAEAAEDAATARTQSGDTGEDVQETPPPATARRARGTARPAAQSSSNTREASASTSRRRPPPPQALDREPRLSGGPG